MFWIRYAVRENGTLVTKEHTLRPAPTEIDYPEMRDYKLQVTQDGAVVIQRPLRDSRVRSWTWKGYVPQLVSYEEQWKLLESLEYRARLGQNLPGTVEIWEDVSGVGGFDRRDGNGARAYTKVKFVQVNRTPRKGGGFVTYEDSVVEFVIADDNYKSF